jgi:hypothetical protein
VSDAARILHLVSPGDVIEGVNAAIFDVIAEGSPAVMAAGLPGWVYIVAALAFAGGSLALVVRRYQTVTV